MEQATGRKKTGKYIPDALTSSKRKNRSLGRTRRRKEKLQRAESADQTPEKSLP